MGEVQTEHRGALPGQRDFPTTELRDEHGRGVPNAFARLERAIRTREKR